MCKTNERKEIIIKTDLLNFVRNNFVFEGREDLIEDKVLTIVDSLFKIFLKFNNKNDSETGGAKISVK